MMSIAQVRSAGSAGNYYTDKDNYYVLGSMGERWAGRGAEQLGLRNYTRKLTHAIMIFMKARFLNVWRQYRRNGLKNIFNCRY